MGSEQRTKVYVPDAEAIWLPAEVIEAEDNRVIVQAWRAEPTDPGLGLSEKIELTLEPPYVDASSLPLQNEPLESGAEDMCTLDYLHEAGVLFNLRQRYFQQLPYTYTGNVCIAINPYQWLGHLYTDETRESYLDASKRRDELPPHAYAISAAAYRGVSKIEDARWMGSDQSILVSGESGAGKTESVKIMMAHLASISGSTADGSESTVVDKVLRSQPLLESFGNAKTVRNDNSSRFGKFTQLEFALEEQAASLAQARVLLVGSRCRTYLLEKSRVVHQAEGERSYHCFYGLARNDETRQANASVGQLPDLDTLRYLKESDLGTQAIENVPDAERHARTWAALDLVGLVADERVALERLLAAILLLGQLDFVAGADDDCSLADTSADDAKAAASALGVESDKALAIALTERTMRARNDVYKVPLDVVKATDARDALGKEVYVRAFDWIVAKINASTSSGVPLANSEKRVGNNFSLNVRVVGLLDIFGFESFKINRFEQLCINYTNEKLQQKFTMDLFKTVQQEYDEERVPWTHISFPDNAAVLQLIDGRMGIIDVLNEEGVRPRGSDEGFVSKLNTLHSSKEADARFVPSKLHKDQFSIAHYAGRVTYTATGWLERNQDTLQEDLAALARQSAFELVARLFAPVAIHSAAKASKATSKRRGSAIAADTVSTKFKAQLAQLMEEIERTSVQYVRCVKPNTRKSSANYDSPMVAEQLRCAGVIEAIRVSRAGYPNKLPHAEFARRFAALLKNVPASLALPEKAAKDAAIELLGSEIDESHEDGAYAIGATRIYFKAGILESLERRRAAALAGRATKLAAEWRCHAAFRAYRRARHGAILLEARARKLAKRSAFVKTLAAAIIAESARRAVISRRIVVAMRRNDRARRIESVARGRARRVTYRKLRVASTLMAAHARRRAAVKAYVIALAEAKEQAKLENQLEAMQRKLQAMEEANRAMAAQAAAQAEPAVKVVEVTKVVEKEVPVQRPDDTSHEMIKLLQQLRADNDRLRKEAAQLRDENQALKRRVADLEAGQSMRLDWLTAARSTLNNAATSDDTTKTTRRKSSARKQEESVDAKSTDSTEKPSRRQSSSVSRFANIVSSLGFGSSSTPTKQSQQRAVEETTPESSPASNQATTPEVTPQVLAADKRRAPHIALPLNRFWQDVPVASLAGALPQRTLDVVHIHLKVGGQYLCATGPPIDPASGSPSQGDEARYLRREQPARGDGNAVGYRTAMEFRVECVGEVAPEDGTSSYEEQLQRCKFRLKSKSTGGYVTVGGLFQRYCLVASAQTPAEAATFQFVARRKRDDDDEDLLGGSAADSAPSMERLRSRQLLVALRVLDGPKASHFCRVRPDGFVNVAPPASAAAARGSLHPDDRTTPLLSVELLVPLTSYEITFASSQLGLIVSKTMPLRVVRFKDAGDGAVSSAELSGRIGVGDVLCTADSKDLLKCTRRQAVDIITSIRPIVISFRVAHAAQDLLSASSSPIPTPASTEPHIDLLTP